MTADPRDSHELLTDQAEEVYCSALEYGDASERTAFVEKSCANNPELRSQVETLLSVEREADTLFAEAGTVLMAADDLRGTLINDPVIRRSVGLQEPPGTMAGNYRLVEIIGEGGCGVVYLAEQEKPLHRRVALKIIKLGMDTQSVITRFEAERQALAMMDHPNIARVLDAGATERGRPYFVMELVTGVKITNYCEEHELSLRERLKLFIQVCHALQHAHQKGIIHRDIKASNILVTAQGDEARPMVIDFGIAKAVEGRLTNDTLFTPNELFIGTPAYMSPEQAQMSALDVDTRSDIYSMGVLLYELVAGRTPFDTSELMKLGVDEMRRALREKEPVAPSAMAAKIAAIDSAKGAAALAHEMEQLAASLKGDLDCITLKALEKDRDRRYQTANGLAADIQRYLDNEPVSARPPSRLYRLRKLVRRNRIVFAAGAAVALTLMAGLGVTLVLWRRAVAAEQEQARLRAVAEHGLAVQEELRHESVWRGVIQQAALMINRKQFSDADKLVENVTDEPTTMEGADVLRTLGYWNATHEKWDAATSRFQTLLLADRFDTADRTSVDFTAAAVALIKSGKYGQYDAFRDKVVADGKLTENGIVMERILKSCLLLPAPADFLKKLEPFAQKARAASQRKDYSPKGVTWDVPWRCMTLALWEYRSGDFSEANTWASRCLESGETPYPRSVTARLIRAMALHQMGKEQQAAQDLAHVRPIIESRNYALYMNGSDEAGFWFDWRVVQILEQEAGRMMQAKVPGAQ